MIRVGYTGTRRGMNGAQIIVVGGLLSGLACGGLEGHHGDCVGGDEEFHRLARARGARIVVHPPLGELFRAFVVGDENRPAFTHLARNRNIVAAVDVLIAAPYEQMHQPRGGTWYTYDRAMERGIPVALCLPSGLIMRSEGWPS